MPLLAVFARPSVVGQTKTRLIPALGAEGALSLYEAFLADTLTVAGRVVGARVEVWWSSPEGAPDVPFAARVQPEGDLGHRMATALASADRAVVIGSDAPTLPPRIVDSALELLNRRDVVLAPASDGGYVLLGARVPMYDILTGVRWSTRYALAETVARAREHGRTVGLLEPWYDVDTPEDLRLLRAHLAVRPEAAVHTARALRIPWRASEESVGS